MRLWVERTTFERNVMICSADATLECLFSDRLGYAVIIVRGCILKKYSDSLVLNIAFGILQRFCEL